MDHAILVGDARQGVEPTSATARIWTAVVRCGVDRDDQSPLVRATCSKCL